MNNNVKKAIEEYQCSGCVAGGDISCFKQNENGVGCGRHCAGTRLYGIGLLLLGMPKGFNRLGDNSKLKPNIYETFESFDWDGYDKFNIPVWKFLSPEGHTFVRGLSPRVNQSFIHIFLEDCMDKIDCLEISQEDVDNMD